MKPYRALSGNAGIVSFAEGDDFIRLQFVDGSVYLYNYASTGKPNVEQMKRLAKSGKGLTTFLNQHVRENYAERIK
jgi:hypothetical protein